MNNIDLKLAIAMQVLRGKLLDDSRLYEIFKWKHLRISRTKDSNIEIKGKILLNIFNEVVEENLFKRYGNIVDWKKREPFVYDVTVDSVEFLIAILHKIDTHDNIRGNFNRLNNITAAECIQLVENIYKKVIENNDPTDKYKLNDTVSRKIIQILGKYDELIYSYNNALKNYNDNIKIKYDSKEKDVYSQEYKIIDKNTGNKILYKKDEYGSVYQLMYKIGNKFVKITHFKIEEKYGKEEMLYIDYLHNGKAIKYNISNERKNDTVRKTNVKNELIMAIDIINTMNKVKNSTKDVKRKRLI